MKEKCLIVDGNNLLYSSHYVAQKLPWKMKQGTIFLLLRVLISILKKNDYQKLLFVFDGGGTNFRETLFPQYKAQREGMPKELYEQMETFKLLLEKTNITYIQLENHEADDLIASFIEQNQTKYSQTIFDVFTRDKDLLQLLAKNVNILKYIDNKITLFSQDDFEKKYNFFPSNYIDYLSILGDKVDNIEGVKGIGPVNAKKIVQKFQTVEKIYQEINFLPETTKNLLENNKELVFRNKKIISLKKNISLPAEKYNECNFCWEKWKKNKELENFCLDSKFTSVLKSLD